MALSGTSTPIRCRYLVSRMSCMISLSKLTSKLPVSGWRTMSVACSPALESSMDLRHARSHSVSNATSAFATVLYVFTVRLLSLVRMIISLAANLRMGSSMRRSSCRDHMMSPATGGALRGNAGACLCFS